MSDQNDSRSKLPPQNLEAEIGLIGSILLWNGCLDDVAPILKAEDFYRDTHQILYRAIRDLYDAGKPVDLITLGDELTRRDQFKKIGGTVALADFMDATPHAANALEYAQIVRQKAIGRALIDCSQKTLADTYSNLFTSEQLIEMAEGRIFSIAQGTAVDDVKQVGDLGALALDRINERKDTGCSGVATGFADIDVNMGVLAPESLVILAARPSIGKTALAINIAEHAAFYAAKPVLVISLEMSGIDLAERLLIGLSRVEGHKVRTGKGLGLTEKTALSEAAEMLFTPGRLWIDDSPIHDVSQIAAIARRFCARHDIQLIVIDYLQLIGSNLDSRVNRQEQVAAISRRLKMLAKELKVPILCVSQLNRKSEDRGDKRPQLADLRESGAIEQDADIVLLLHRPDFYDCNDSPGLAELVVAKNRHGATGMVTLTFLKDLARFENYCPEFGAAPKAARVNGNRAY